MVGVDEDTNLPRWMTIKFGNELHSPPDGRPSHVLFDVQGRPYQFSWHHFNTLHREDGPARLKINPDNGVHVREEFRNVFKSDWSPDDVSTIIRDKDTGNTLVEYYHVDRKDGPPEGASSLEPN